MTDLDCAGFNANATLIQPTTEDPIFLLGIVAIIASSAGASLGLILQKRAHNKQQAASDDDKSRSCLGIPLNFQWALGFVLFAFWPLPFEFAAYSVAPQSLIVPFGGLTIIFNQIMAPYLLPEKLTKIEVYSAVVIVIGLALLSAGVGGNVNPDYDDPCEILGRYVDTEILVLVFLLAGLIVAAYFVIYYVPRFEPWDPFFFAFVAAGVNTYLQTLFKAVALMAQYDLDGGNSFSTIYPYLHLVACLVLAVTVASFVNLGLARYETIIFQPLYICTLIVISSSVGAIFYEEYNRYQAWNYVLWFLGMALVVAGVFVLSRYGCHTCPPFGSGILGNKKVTDATDI